ncbi:MAG TPA: adenylate/guanylate cyclase domain-containing protein [Myxococcus sp.]|nr:adenylate/guanylate cyclase domain-containing protein [Myxococcus sp.]
MTEATLAIVRQLFERELRAAERTIASIRVLLLGIGLFVLLPLRTWHYGTDFDGGKLGVDLAIIAAGFGLALAYWLWLRRGPRGLAYAGILLDYAILGALMVELVRWDHVPQLGLTIETYKLVLPVGLALNILSGVRMSVKPVVVSGVCCALLVVLARALDVEVHGAPIYLFTNVLLLSLVLATSLGAAFMVRKTRALIGEASTLQAEAGRVKDVLARYVSRPVADAVLADQVPQGAGRRQRVTVMFSDIRGFTTLSEKLPPEDVVTFLNAYFSRMVGAVFAFDGMLDKYIGDGLMAVFGAPIVHQDHALRAVRAAFRMRDELATLNEELKARGQAPVAIGIGLHTGECVVGNIGTEQRMDYTAIGDTVNTSSRIEGLTKEHGVDILVSAETYEEVRAFVLARRIPDARIRGRAAAVDLYALEKLRFDGPEAEDERTEVSVVRW